jgi:phosphoglycolate phosphatase
MNEAQAPLAVAFDVDGTLISSGGAGDRAWLRAFHELWSVEADVNRFTKNGMTDPEVSRLILAGVIERDPTPTDLTRLMQTYMRYVPTLFACENSRCAPWRRSGEP